MRARLVTGNTGVAVTPADDGALYAGLVGDGVVCLDSDGSVPSVSEVAGSEQITPGNAVFTYKYLVNIPAGTYICHGRQVLIEKSEDVIDVTDAENGALVGLMFSRDTDGKETVQLGVWPSDSALITDIDLQNSGVIVFCVVGFNDSLNIGKYWVKEDRIIRTLPLPSLYGLSGLYRNSITAAGVDTPDGAVTTLLKKTNRELGFGAGCYMVILSVSSTTDGSSLRNIYISFGDEVGLQAHNNSMPGEYAQVIAIHTFSQEAIDTNCASISAAINTVSEENGVLETLTATATLDIIQLA